MGDAFPVTHQLVPGTGSTLYVVVVLTALIATAWWWSRRFRSDPRLIQVFAGAVVGAFVGASAGFWVAEGWLHWAGRGVGVQLVTGKTVLGALLGGYLGVELAKKAVGLTAPTGDSFAAVVPLGIALGRLGCLAHGCCLGVRLDGDPWYGYEGPAGAPRWPAPVAEILFNLAAFGVFLVLRRHRVLPGQHFHLYLIAYGLFRFAHEFVRDTPRLVGPISGYHLLSLCAVALGTVGFIRRRRETARPGVRPDEIAPGAPP